MVLHDQADVVDLRELLKVLDEALHSKALHNRVHLRMRVLVEAVQSRDKVAGLKSAMCADKLMYLFLVIQVRQKSFELNVST